MLRRVTFMLAIVGGVLAALCGQGELAIGFLFWPLAFFTVGCYACACVLAGCLIGQDLFDSGLGQFTIESGAPTVSGGSLLMTGGDRVRFNLTPGDAGDPVHIRINALRTGGSDPSVLRIFAGSEDTNNEAWGELSLDVAGNSATIRGGDTINGSDEARTITRTLHDDTESNTDRHALEFCYIPGEEVSEPEGRRLFLVGYSADSGGSFSSDNEVLLGDGIGATAGLSNVDPTASMTVNFRAPIPPGSTVTRVQAGVTCKATQAQPITLPDGVAVNSNAMLVGQAIGVGAVVGPDWGTIGGDVGDPSNMHWRDLARGLVTVTIGFLRATGPLADILEVDVVGLDIDYLGPNRKPARISITYTNTEVGADPETQCASGVLEYVTASGKRVGIEAISGDWDIADFYLNYHKSTSRPACPECNCSLDACICCQNADPSQSYIVDLSEVLNGILYDYFQNGRHYCDFCENKPLDEFLTSYVLEWQRGDSSNPIPLPAEGQGSEDFCYWTYSDVEYCPIPFLRSFAGIQIWLWLTQGSTPNLCKWRLLVTLGWNTPGTLPGGTTPCVYSVILDSADLPEGDCSGAPFTLTEISNGRFNSLYQVQPASPATTQLEAV